MKKISTKGNYWGRKDVVGSFSEKPVSEHVKEFLKFSGLIRTGVNALDVGCGGGRHTLLLLKNGFEVYACDASIKMVNSTRDKIAAVKDIEFAQSRVIQVQMDKLPYESGFFEIVISSGVLHNARSKKELKNSLLETARVLKPSGLLYLKSFYYSGWDTEHLLSKSKNSTSIYVNKYGEEMTLLQLEDFLSLVPEKLKLIEGVKTYTKEVETGKRDIFYGYFRKSE